MGRSVLLALMIVGCSSAAAVGQTPTSPSERTGEEIYRAGCVSCHGPDGKGQPKAVLGFEPPATFPDFTNCAVSSVEPDDMWVAIVHRGGRVRGESHIMPAFEDLLSDVEIDRVVQYLHSLCAEPKWPRGNLNFPRAFFTEKAFPENETVFTVTALPSHPQSIETRVDYERRIGRRAQLEVGGPFTVQQDEAGSWSRGLGDVNAALKYVFLDSNRHGSIASAGGEVTLPTGKETEGLGGGVTIFEAFGLFDQALPRDAFLQIHTGFEWPADTTIEPNSFYWRTAVGKTVRTDRFGRMWTPMVEVLAARDLVNGAETEWDLVPEMQVSLSVFQHVRLSVGVRIPVNERQTRSDALLTYLLWDWGDGSLFKFWRAH
ncbi:MAG TPA: cytochrome c [Vicinamibacterales bacterium]|nr:cytochrome c [Vicinamibacterales bacterium]